MPGTMELPWIPQNLGSQPGGPYTYVAPQFALYCSPPKKKQEFRDAEQDKEAERKEDVSGRGENQYRIGQDRAIVCRKGRGLHVGCFVQPLEEHRCPLPSFPNRFSAVVALPFAL